MASFGAPRGKRLGDATKAMPLHRLVAATPPIALRRPNPKGASALRTISASRPGPDAQRHRIPARDTEARTGSPGGLRSERREVGCQTTRRRRSLAIVQSRQRRRRSPRRQNPSGVRALRPDTASRAAPDAQRHRIASRDWSATASPARAAPRIPRPGFEPRPQAGGAPLSLFPFRDTSTPASASPRNPPGRRDPRGCR
jgi:hypothetical protein